MDPGQHHRHDGRDDRHLPAVGKPNHEKLQSRRVSLASTLYLYDAEPLVPWPYACYVRVR